jgi:hypothetical protein
MIIFLLTLILVCLLIMIAAGVVLWSKVNIYLTYNTRYDSAQYEEAVTTRKMKLPNVPASKTETKGRAIVKSDELVDLDDLDFETAVQAIESIGNGS